PAQLVGRRLDAGEVGDETAVVDAPERRVHRPRADAVEPAPAIGAARGGEGRARDLLGVETVGATLRRVAADRQRAGQRFGGELVAEAGHVAQRGGGGHGGSPGSCASMSARARRNASLRTSTSPIWFDSSRISLALSS